MTNIKSKKGSFTIEEVSKYTLGNILPSNNWQSVSSVDKLVYLQVTPIKAIKTRSIAGTIVPYVSIDYVERCLNFISNFNRGIEIQDKWMVENTTTTNKGKETVMYDAWVQAKCYIVLDWVRIERTVFWSWTAYENKAVSRFSVYEGAKSIATKSFADTFGIWSDKKDEENSKIREARETIQAWRLVEFDEWFEAL